MRLLIAYATGEGQTRKIARRVADRVTDRGDTVELLRLDDAEDIGLERFDRVILAAPVHVGRYPRALSDFVERQAARLRNMPTLFLSVSLAAAGHEAGDWRGLDRVLADFEAATGWAPGRVAQIAGAYRPAAYGVFRRFVLRRIVARRDPGADLDREREYTDWPALDALVDAWLAG